jgi:hypothetical protein
MLFIRTSRIRYGVLDQFTNRLYSGNLKQGLKHTEKSRAEARAKAARRILTEKQAAGQVVA